MIRLHKFKLHVCKNFRCLVRIQTTSSEHENIIHRKSLPIPRARVSSSTFVLFAHNRQ